MQVLVQLNHPTLSVEVKPLAYNLTKHKITYVISCHVYYLQRASSRQLKVSKYHV